MTHLTLLAMAVVLAATGPHTGLGPGRMEVARQDAEVARQDAGPTEGVQPFTGRVREEDLLLMMHPLGLTARVLFQLEVDPAVTHIPITAPILEGGIRYPVAAIQNGRPATVTLDREGPPRGGTVELRADRGEGLVELVLSYRIDVEVEESGRLFSRVPVVSIPGEGRGTVVGGAVSRIQLSPGFVLEEASPEGFERVPVATGRLLYRRVSDTLPQVVEVEAQEVGIEAPPRETVRTPLLLGALLLAGSLLWFVVRRMRGRPGGS